jgi:hypothetical protein
MIMITIIFRKNVSVCLPACERRVYGIGSENDDDDDANKSNCVQVIAASFL